MNLKHRKMTVAAALAGLVACAGNLTLRTAADDEVALPKVLDFMVGGGWIVDTPSASKASFNLVAGVASTEVASNSAANNTFRFGDCYYVDPGSRLHVKSTDVTAYTVVDDQTRQIKFTVEINGVPGRATVTVSDQGEPGCNDTFSISLSNGYAASGRLGGGNRDGGNLQVNPSAKPPHREVEVVGL